MEEKYMGKALEEAKKSFKKGEVPVGAIVVKEGKIIAKAHNLKEKKQMVTRHAEIIAIEKACKKIKNWRLDECVMYITLEPCLMCFGAILQSRLPKIVYATSSQKYGYTNNVDQITENNHKPIIIKGICEEKSRIILKEFFKDKRS